MKTGEYDDVAGELILKHQASICILVIVNGDRGNGFSIAVTDPTFMGVMPQLLRELADSVETEQPKVTVYD